MSGSRFWTVGQCLHWIVFRTLPEDGEQITHIRLCLRYGAGLAPATMGPNEALDELQAALEEGRLSASGQCSTITRDMIGDRRQIEPTRGYVPEVFWQGARIDRDKMDSAVDATGERWTALLCPRAVVTSLWPLQPAAEKVEGPGNSVPAVLTALPMGTGPATSAGGTQAVPKVDTQASSGLVPMFPQDRATIGAESGGNADVTNPKGSEEERFPSSPPTRQSSRCSEADAQRWYRERVASFEQDPSLRPPSRLDDEVAGAKLGISSGRVRKLRIDLAPSHWQARGRPRKNLA